jgi:hypothetical protein
VIGIMSTLVETSAALALPEVKTGLVEWSWQNKYGVITETPIPKPGESLHCRPVGTEAYASGKIIAANADGSYDVAFGRQVYRNVRNDGFYGVRETPAEGANQLLLLEAHCLEVKPYPAQGFGKDGKLAIGLNTVWFDLFERCWYTTSSEQPNIALNVSFLNGGQRTREAATTKKAPAVELVDIDDEIERERAGFASDSTDSEDGINPTNATPVKPRRRVGIPPSPGDILTQLRTPARPQKPSTPERKPAAGAKKSPHVGIPPSPADK